MKTGWKFDPYSQLITDEGGESVAFVDPQHRLSSDELTRWGHQLSLLPELYAFVESYAHLPCSCDDTNPGGCESCGARLLIDEIKRRAG